MHRSTNMIIKLRYELHPEVIVLLKYMGNVKYRLEINNHSSVVIFGLYPGTGKDLIACDLSSSWNKGVF
jgi:hypothetical protein